MTVTQRGMGWGKGRRVIVTIVARPEKLRMAKATLRRRQARRR